MQRPVVRAELGELHVGPDGNRREIAACALVELGDGEGRGRRRVAEPVEFDGIGCGEDGRETEGEDSSCAIAVRIAPSAG